MIDASQIVDALVKLLRDIPELVSEMGAKPERIYAYHDHYPKNSSLAYALHEMPTPAIMVAWQGTQPGSLSGNEVWKHQLALYLRAGDLPTSYYRLFRLLTRGVPISVGIPMANVTVHASCYPMDLPTIQRATDAEGLDYFEVSTTFTELGDD